MAPRTTPADHFGKRASELGTHRAVEDEVYRAVDEHRSVPDISQRNVHVVEDTAQTGTVLAGHTRLTALVAVPLPGKTLMHRYVRYSTPSVMCHC